jgi:uncharacterized membrane protein
MNAEGPSPTRPALLLVLAYLPLLGFLSLAVSRDREVRWHSVNGLLFFGAAAAIALAATLVGILAPSLTCLYAVAMGILALLYVSIMILAIVVALRGGRLLIPLVSSHAGRRAPSDED